MPTVAPPGTATLEPNVVALLAPMLTTFTPATCPPHSGPQFRTYALVSSLLNTALKGLSNPAGTAGCVLSAALMTVNGAVPLLKTRIVFPLWDITKRRALGI